MRILMAVLLFIPKVAQAHPSLLPHDHDHWGALLPDIGMLVLSATVLFSAGLVACAKMRKD